MSRQPFDTVHSLSTNHQCIILVQVALMKYLQHLLSLNTLIFTQSTNISMHMFSNLLLIVVWRANKTEQGNNRKVTNNHATTVYTYLQGNKSLSKQLVVEDGGKTVSFGEIYDVTASLFSQLQLSLLYILTTFIHEVTISSSYQEQK